MVSELWPLGSPGAQFEKLILVWSIQWNCLLNGSHKYLLKFRLKIRLKFQNLERRFPILGFTNDTNPWCLHHWCHHTCHKPLIMNVWHNCQRSTTPCLLTMGICFVERFSYIRSVSITLVIVTKISFWVRKEFSRYATMVFFRTRPVTATSIFGPAVLASCRSRLARWEPFVYWLVIFFSIGLTDKSKGFVTIIIIPEKNITAVFIDRKIVCWNVCIIN